MRAVDYPSGTKLGSASSRHERKMGTWTTEDPEFQGTENGCQVCFRATGNSREKDEVIKGTQPDQPKPTESCIPESNIPLRMF